MHLVISVSIRVQVDLSCKHKFRHESSLMRLQAPEGLSSGCCMGQLTAYTYTEQSLEAEQFLGMK